MLAAVKNMVDNLTLLGQDGGAFKRAVLDFFTLNACKSKSSLKFHDTHFLSAAKENFSENQAKTYPSHGGSYSSDCSYRVERQKDQKKGLPPDRATSQPTNLNG